MLQIVAPVAASSAMIFMRVSTTGVVTYMMPSTTSGVVSKLSNMPVCTVATGSSDATLFVVICVSGEYRQLA